MARKVPLRRYLSFDLKESPIQSSRERASTAIRDASFQRINKLRVFEEQRSYGSLNLVNKIIFLRSSER